MPEGYLGKDAIVKIDNTVNTLVTITGDQSGFESTDYQVENDSREIPNQSGEVQRQSLGRKDLQMTFRVDQNSVTAPVFQGAAGDTRSIEVYEAGMGSGLPYVKAEVLIRTVGLTSGYNTTNAYAVQLELKHSLDVGVQS